MKSDVVKLDIDKVKYVSTGLRNKEDKLDIEKLETTPDDLSKLSNLVRNVVRKMNMMNWLKKVIISILLILGT